MANYFNAGISEVSFQADEDLSAWQWQLVMAASTNGYVQKFDLLTEATCPRSPVGVLVNSPSTGQVAAIKCLGFAKAKGLVSACDLRQGAVLTACAGHFVSASTSSQPAYGIWFGPTITSGSGYGNVLLNMFPPSGTQMINTNN